jgi:biopolymer transport protein ExbD
LVLNWKAVASVVILEALVPAYAAGRPPDYVQCQMPSDVCDVKYCPRVIGEHAELSVESDGTIFWNGEKVDQKKLIAYTTNAAKQHPQAQFIIWPRVDTPYGKVASLLKTLQKNGIELVACAVPKK